MKNLAVGVCAVALAASTVLAVDVSGTWSVDGDVVGNPVKFACELKQNGDVLSGTAKLEGKDAPITGSVKENVVTFEYDADSQGTTYHLVFTGTLGEDGGMKGTIAVAGVEGTFTAKKH